jgi:hypothetical protein
MTWGDYGRVSVRGESPECFVSVLRSREIIMSFRRIGLSFLLLTALPRAVGAQTVTAPASLGIVAMHQTNGTTTATMDANATNFNDWSDGGWQAERLPLALPHRYGITSTWELPQIDGLSLMCNGGGDTRSELAVDSTMGIASGLVWGNRSDHAGPVLRIPSYGGHVDGALNIYGNYGTGLLADLIADTTNRVDVGLEMTGQQPNGVGTGKWHFDTLATILCKTGVKVVNTPTEDNGDETQVGRFLAYYCTDYGFHSVNDQCLGWMFRYAMQQNTPVMWWFERGGDFACDQLVALQGEVGLRITGNDQFPTSVLGVFKFGIVEIDASADDDYKIVEVNPDSGFNAASIDIGFIHNELAHTVGAPLIDLHNSYGQATINGGEFLMEGIVKTTGGISTNFPTVRIRNGKFIVGSGLSDIRKYFTTDSSGYVQVIVEGNSEFHGGSGQVNNGRLYPDFVGLINIDSSTTYQLISGGYSERPGRIAVAYSASMTPDARLAYTFVITPTNGTAFTINAPSTGVQGQRIRITVKNTFGTLGAITFGSGMKLGSAAFNAPANGKNRSIDFEFDGTNWLEVGRSEADVTN